MSSHPSRVRELKHNPYKMSGIRKESHPSRVRELKRDGKQVGKMNLHVAPLPGA